MLRCTDAVLLRPELRRVTERIAIVGSRNYPSERRVRTYVARLRDRDVVIVSGGAQGPDRWAENEAHLVGLPVEVYRPDWSTGRDAGLKRNTTIVERSDRVVAFWDGLSRGTLDTIRKAARAGKPVLILGPPA